MEKLIPTGFKAPHSLLLTGLRTSYVTTLQSPDDEIERFMSLSFESREEEFHSDISQSQFLIKYFNSSQE